MGDTGTPGLSGDPGDQGPSGYPGAPGAPGSRSFATGAVPYHPYTGTHLRDILLKLAFIDSLVLTSLLQVVQAVPGFLAYLEPRENKETKVVKATGQRVNLEVLAFLVPLVYQDHLGDLVSWAPDGSFQYPP